MGTRRTYWQKHWLEIVLVLVIAVLVAFISNRLYARADLTSDKVFTLTKATKNVLRSIDGIVNLKLYMSRDLPPDYIPASERIKDVLSEYEAYGGGRFRVQIIDPTNNPEAKKRAEEVGIPEVQAQGLSRDELVVKRVHFGLVMTYRDKSEVMPVLQNPSNLEYDLTSRLIKLTREKTPVLGIIDFSRSYDPPDTESQSRFNLIKDALRERFEVKTIELEKELEIPADVEAVLLLQPIGLSEEAKYVLDQYLLRGGNIFAPTEAIMLSREMQAFPALPGYETVFKEYGVELKKMLVLDESNAMASFSSGFMVIQMPYPLWLLVKPGNFNPEFSPISNLGSLVLPWSGYLSLASEPPPGVAATALLRTTKNAWAVTSPFDLSPQQDWRTSRANSTKQGTFVLGYLLSGKFPSAFPDGPPQLDEDAAEERVQLAKQKLNPAAHLKESAQPGNLVIISNGRFLEDNYLKEFSDNGLFMENIADWMLENDALIGIRSRSIAARPLETEPTEPVKNLIKFGLTVGLPLLVILFGLLRLGLRLRRRQALKQRYATHEG